MSKPGTRARCRPSCSARAVRSACTSFCAACSPATPGIRPTPTWANPAAACAPWRRPSAPRKRMPRGLLISASLALAGCALLPKASPPSPPLLPPAALGAAHQAQQVLHARFGEREIALQCALVADSAAVTLVAVGALGRRLFTASYDGARLNAQTDPQAQLPLPAWQSRLEGSAWQIEQPQPGLRRLSYRGRWYEEVLYGDAAHPWRGRLRIANFALGYTLDIVPQ